MPAGAALGQDATETGAPSTPPTAPIGAGAPVPAPAPTREGEALRLSIDDTVRLALRQNLSLARSRLDHEAARDGLAQAWTTFEPTASTGLSATADAFSPPGLDVSASLPWGGTASVVLDWTSTTASASGLLEQSVATAPTLTVALSQPLLDGLIHGSGWQAVRDARDGVAISSIALERALSDLVIQAEDAYWGVTLAQAEVDAARQTLGFSRDQERVTRERIVEGFQAAIDILQVQEQRASAEARVAGAEAGLEEALDALKALLRLPLSGPGAGPIELVSTPEATVDTGTLEAATTTALLRGYALRQATRERRRAEADRKYAVNRALPDLSASGSVTRVPDGADPTGEREPWEWQVGGTLTVPLSIQQVRLEVRAADRAIRGARLAEDQARSDTEREVRSAYRAVVNQVLQIRLAVERTDYAERKLAAERERLERGQSTIKNVIDFLVDRDQAVRDANAARISLRRAQVALLQAQGILLERYGVKLEEWFR